jgi:cytochrome c553
MSWRETARRYWKAALGCVAAAILVAAAGGMLFAWSGVYSVAASEGHLAIVDWFLRFSMRNSVKKHSSGIEPPQRLDDPALVRLGAAHYYSGCMPCHGGPGHQANAVFQHSLPGPPELTGASSHWRDRELYWLVKHGIKYTGMPGWSARDRIDEQWAVVAFLKAMPSLSKENYEDLALGGYEPERIANEEPSKTFGTDIAQCARCHGDNGTPPKSALVPSLAGQTNAYLINALREYASGARPSGIMQPIATTLTDEQKRAYSSYYSALKVGTRDGTADTEGPGSTIAQEGRPERNIPACDSCHSAGALDTYPRLAGQSRRYLASQLRLWRSGVRRDGALADLMAPIAKRLTDSEIEAVSDYYSRIGSPP